MFISNAFAETTATSSTATTLAVPSDKSGSAAVPEPSPFASVLPLILIFVVFYFLLIRPQQKKIKEHEQMVAGIKRGDKVVTGGGILGVVSKVDADSQHLEVEIATGVTVKVLRNTVVSMLNKPAVEAKSKAEKSDKKPTANDNAESA